MQRREFCKLAAAIAAAKALPIGAQKNDAALAPNGFLEPSED